MSQSFLTDFEYTYFACSVGMNCLYWAPIFDSFRSLYFAIKLVYVPLISTELCRLESVSFICQSAEMEVSGDGWRSLCDSSDFFENEP